MNSAALGKLVRNGRRALAGHANLGYCEICERHTLFVEIQSDLREGYLCLRCDTRPRYRALIHVLNQRFPEWRTLDILECGMGGPTTRKLRREVAGYIGSRFVPDVALGSNIHGGTCQNLERLTYPDESFDLVITQDVLEHVLRPNLAVREIARVLRPGGAHVFTVPIYHGHRSLVRVVPSDSGVQNLLPEEFHGEPGNPTRSLVVTEWGDDFPEFVATEAQLVTELVDPTDRRFGLDGPMLEVAISSKPPH